MPASPREKEIKNLQRRREDLARRYYYMGINERGRNETLEEIFVIDDQLAALKGEPAPEHVVPTTPADIQAVRDATTPVSVKQQQAQAEMVKGFGCLVIGAIITGGSYLLATSGDEGGSYIVLRGAILFGAFFFLRGLIKYISAR